jgi:hypothetical protein
MADTGPGRTTDLDLRGRAVIRLVDAGPDDLRAVRRQLGPLPTVDAEGPGASARQPDVTVRFVARLDPPGPVRRIGPDALLIGDTFVLTRGQRQTEVRVEVPVAILGSAPATIVAERRGTSIPLLLPILGASLLARGLAPAHASAFALNGLGVLVSGWAKGGKSEALLAFLSHGARYVGDEWLFIDPAGPTMFGPPEPIRLWDWQLEQVPVLRGRVGARDRARLLGAEGTSTVLGAVTRTPRLGRSPIGEAARRARAVVDRQRSRQFAVEDLFGRGTVQAEAVSIDRLVLVSAADEATVRTDVDPDEAAARIAATTAHELLDLEAVRLAYRHGVPDGSTTGLEGLEARLRSVYRQAFGDVPIVEVRHPHPVDIEGLHRLIDPAL